MRPPLNAGENAAVASIHASADTSFNEAPAERGGKLPEGRKRKRKRKRLQ